MNQQQKLNSLIDMAAGTKLADLLIINGKIVDVFNQTIIEQPLAIGEGKIVGWGDYQAHQVIDAKGAYILPGLIDGHVHIESSSLSPAQFSNIILPHGTTTIIADPHEIGNVCGLQGIQYILDSAKTVPLNIQVMLPSCVPATPYEQSGAELLAEQLATLKDDPNVLGLGEVMDYPSVVNHAPSMMDKLWLAKNQNWVIDGHSPGVRGKNLTAYVASGIMTDHECSNASELIARLSMGMYILLREGSTCKDLLNLIPAITPQNAPRCIMCTDDREPVDILTSGHINKNLRLAVAAGMPALQAITLATINSATCYRLKSKGAIAPGYDADIVLMDNLEEFNALSVFCKGVEVAKNGKILNPSHNIDVEAVKHTIHIAPLDVNHFKLPLTSQTIRVIHVEPGSVVTQAKHHTVEWDEQHCFDAKLNPGFNKIAVIERHHATGNIGLGVIDNYGVANGAIAISVAHDSHNIVVVGDNDKDMYCSVKELERIGGGIAICQEGKILANLPLPIAGLMSDQPAEMVAKQVERLLHLINTKLGITHNPAPLMSLVFMTLPVIPEIKLTANGLFDIKAFKLVDICS